MSKYNDLTQIVTSKKDCAEKQNVITVFRNQLIEALKKHFLDESNSNVSEKFISLKEKGCCKDGRYYFGLQFLIHSVSLTKTFYFIISSDNTDTPILLEVSLFDPTLFNNLVERRSYMIYQTHIGLNNPDFTGLSEKIYQLLIEYF